jgi:hypothetical protein
MFSNSLKMVKIDWSMSELRKIVCRRYNINISTIVGFVVWFIIDAGTRITLRMFCNTETWPILTEYFTSFLSTLAVQSGTVYAYPKCVSIRDIYDLYAYFKRVPC